MKKVVSIFESAPRVQPKGFSPSDIEQQKRDFEARGGRVHVVPCVARDDKLPSDYTRGRMNALTKRANSRSSSSTDFDPPPQAA